jgi:hypothetical protein
MLQSLRIICDLNACKGFKPSAIGTLLLRM